MTENFFRTPGPMGYSCDHVVRNPQWQPDSDGPLLLRCYQPAVTRFTFRANGITSVTKRCLACADVLRAQADLGKVEVLGEKEI